MLNILKKYKNYLYLIGLLIFSLLLLSFIYLISNISYDAISIIIIFINLLFTFFLGYLFAKSSNKKGIISGLIIGIVYIVLLVVLGLLFKSNLSLSSILYYFIIILISIMGGIIAKNKR